MKYPFIIFALGLALGLFISFMYHTVGYNPTLSKPQVAATKGLQAKVNNEEKVFAQKADSFQKQNQNLQAALRSTKAELRTAKQKAHSLHVAIYELLDKSYEKATSSVEENSASCDSLITTVEELMQNSVLKDSLYENAINNLEQQAKNKDSTITLKDNQYSEIKAAFTKSIEGQVELIEQNKFLGKQVKIQKIKSKVLSGALLILTGAATTYFISR